MAEAGRVDAQNPWPWLDPFTESASGFFNGRGDDAQALLRSVLATPACVLFGKSGLGKTSLLLAGLFPLLRERCLLPVALRRIEHSAGAPSLSAQLLRVLDEAIDLARLRPLGADAGGAAVSDDVAALWERLHDRRQQLCDADGRRWSIVFVLDQFEEIFTLQPDEQLRRQAFEQLGDLLENRLPPSVAARLDRYDELLDQIDLDSQPYRFLIALREDFLPEIEAWADLIPRLGPNRYRLLPMASAQALDAVQKTGGALVDAASAQSIVEFLGRQTAETVAARMPCESLRIEPALLSLVCASLNADRLAHQPPAAQLDVTNIEARGAQILDRFYDQAFAALPEAQREPAARWVEVNLITEGGTRRPYPLAAVEEALRPALRTLVDGRLLRVQNTEQGDQVELAHDRLAEVASGRAQALRQQAEAAGRLERAKEAAELELFKQRARAAELAEERAVLERTRAVEALAASRRARRLWIGLGLVLAGALFMSWWAWTESERAVNAMAAAAEQKMVATGAVDKALVAATQAHDAAKLLKADQPDRSAQASALLANAKRSYTSAVQASLAFTCPTGARLYPQIGAAQDSVVVERLTPALRAAGFIVPRTELLSPQKMPAVTEVRYFRNDEESGALAATAALAEAGLRGVPTKYVRGYENATSMRPCTYELWLVAAGDGKR